MNSNKSVDEIDLFEVFLKIIRIVRNNFLLIVTFFLLGTLLGFLWYSTVPKEFESKMLITSDILTESYSEEVTENLNSLISENNQAELAKRLNISEKESAEIRKIVIENTDDKPQSSKEKEKIFLLITVTVTSQSIIATLQQKLVAYLENNNFVKIRVQQKKDFLTSMIKKINEEIASLEEFKNKIYKGDFFTSAKGTIMLDPTLLNTAIIDLTKEKIEYENDLQIVESVQVVEGFTILNNPTSPKLSVALASGSFVGLFFVAMLIAFKGVRKIVRLEENASK